MYITIIYIYSLSSNSTFIKFIYYYYLFNLFIFLLNVHTFWLFSYIIFPLYKYIRTCTLTHTCTYIDIYILINMHIFTYFQSHALQNVFLLLSHIFFSFHTLPCLLLAWFLKFLVPTTFHSSSMSHFFSWTLWSIFLCPPPWIHPCNSVDHLHCFRYLFFLLSSHYSSCPFLLLSTCSSSFFSWPLSLYRLSPLNLPISTRTSHLYVIVGKTTDHQTYFQSISPCYLNKRL